MQDKGICYIFGALPVDELSYVPDEKDYVIAADKGYDVALSLGIKPDLVIGDFDSRGEVPDFDNVIKLKVRKDDTDVGHAVQWALDRGYTKFIIYGASGGKLDHTFANIQIASDIIRKTAEYEGQVVFVGDMCFSVIKDSYISFDENNSGRISVFSLSDKSVGVSIEGLSYEAHEIDIDRYFPLGVSNSFVGTKARVSVKKGELLVIWEK